MLRFYGKNQLVGIAAASTLNSDVYTTSRANSLDEADRCQGTLSLSSCTSFASCRMMRPAWLSRWPGLRGSQSICIRTNRAFGSVAIRCCCDGRRSERRFLPCARSGSRTSFRRIPCLVWLL